MAPATAPPITNVNIYFVISIILNIKSIIKVNVCKWPFKYVNKIGLLLRDAVTFMMSKIGTEIYSITNDKRMTNGQILEFKISKQLY